METLHVKIEGEQKELIIRTGEALELKPPREITLSGCIDSVQNWLKKRKGTFDEKKAFIIVSYNGYRFKLMVDEKEPYNTTIESVLELSPEFKMFGINSDRKWEPQKLSEFIKMNRSFLESKDIAADLVTRFKNFKTTVNKIIDKVKDDRGSYDEKRSQAVDSSLPPKFNVKLPIFQGMEAITSEIEVYIDPVSLDCSLVSPVANDFIHETSKQLMDTELIAIAELCPDIAIIYT